MPDPDQRIGEVVPRVDLQSTVGYKVAITQLLEIAHQVSCSGYRPEVQGFVLTPGQFWLFSGITGYLGRKS